MEENLKKTIKYMEERICELKNIEEKNGGWNLYDECDIGLCTEFETLEKILEMLKGS